MEEHALEKRENTYEQDRQSEIRMAEAQAAYMLAGLLHANSMDAEIEAAEARLAQSEACNDVQQIAADKIAVEYWKGVKRDLYLIRHQITPGDE